MGQRSEQIESEIQEERDRLRSNLDELGNRVRSVTDWRQQFRDHPALGLGLAFGAGLLLAGLLRPTARSPGAYARRDPEFTGEQRPNPWGPIQRTLLGVVTGTLLDLVPAFRAHLRDPAQRGRASGSGNGTGVQGEGDYAAARRYRAGVERHVSSADVAAEARAAAPRSEAEAEELEAAVEEGRSRAKPPRE